MTPIVKTDVTNFAGQLSSLPDGAWTDILTFVNQFNLSVCDSDQDRRMARIYLAAHIGQTLKDAKSGAAGPVTSSAVGDIRRSFGLIAMAASGSNLKTTRYGQLFEDLLLFTAVAGPVLL